MNTTENNIHTKRLYRSKKNKMIAGVCGGFAEYLNIDPVLVRIAWVAFTFLGGSGLIIYIIGIIIIPENPVESDISENNSKSRNDSALFWGSLFILVGAALLLKQFGFFYYFNIWQLPWKTIWSFILIIIGILMLYNFAPIGYKKSAEDTDGHPPYYKGKKRICRSRNKMIAGVCGGLAEYFDVDPNLVRLGYALLSIASFGMGLVIYIVLMIILPSDDSIVDESNSIEKEQTDG